MARRKRRSKKPQDSLFRKVAAFGKMAALVLIIASLLPVLALRWLDPPASAFMLRHGFNALLAGEDTRYRYQWTDWEAIADTAKIAVLAAEDQRFPQHWGFDFDAIRQALGDYRRHGRVRGASTITQQVAKNLFLWPGRNLLRKGLEAYFTVLIELTWPKQRILEIYLNVAEFGRGIYGVGAASRFYFGKQPGELISVEAALLAAVLPNPRVLSVSTPSTVVRKRQNWIVKQMDQLGGAGYLQSL